MNILRLLSGLFGRKSAPKNGPTFSIVLLLREFRDLPQSVLVQAAERGWNADFHSEESGNYVLSGPVASLVQFGGKIFLSILSVPKSYGENPEREAEKIPELRRRRAWAEHKAWLSIDYNGADPSGAAEREQNLILMGSLAAELVNSNCTGLYFPSSNSIVPNDDSLPDRLRIFRSVDSLHSSEVSPVPVVEEDDPRLAAVVAQAKAAWPRFTKAFQKRKPDDRFLVKAQFSDSENGEWMWVDVVSMSDGRITGLLDSTPAVVRSVAQGDEVEVRETDIGDWYYSHDGREEGQFSRVLFE